MTARDFCYWLQGYIEIRGQQGTPLAKAADDAGLTREQLDCVSRHLALVFKHEIDPAAGPAEHQDALNSIHNKPQFGQEIAPGVIARC